MSRFDRQGVRCVERASRHRVASPRLIREHATHAHERVGPEEDSEERKGTEALDPPEVT